MFDGYSLHLRLSVIEELQLLVETSFSLLLLSSFIKKQRLKTKSLSDVLFTVSGQPREDRFPKQVSVSIDWIRIVKNILLMLHNIYLSERWSWHMQM